MADHGARDHATWSASATERNWNCPGALALTTNLPEKESEAAAWGTACHQVSEKCLRSGADADTLIGTTEKTKEHSFEVDEEMSETAQVYVDYCRGRLAEYKAETGEDAEFWIEQRFSLDSLNTPMEAGGTGDFVVFFARWQLLEVVDLKGGRGVVVEVKGNPQLRTYGLGALLATLGLDVTHVKVTIVQPRASHKDGRTRSDTVHVADLVEWTADLLAAMRRSAEAVRQHGMIGTPEGCATLPTWASLYLAAGNHCGKTFCKAQGFCPALEQKALDAVGVWFDDLDQPRLANAPDSLDPAELAKKLDMLDLIEDWISAVRAHAHSQAESGVVIPDYQLVDKQGREKWQDGVEDKVKAAARQAKLADDKFLNPAKLKTPKQVRTALGAANAKLVAGLSTTPMTGTNLVRADKTSRPAVTPGVNKHFDVLN